MTIVTILDPGDGSANLLNVLEHPAVDDLLFPGSVEALGRMRRRAQTFAVTFAAEGRGIQVGTDGRHQCPKFLDHYNPGVEETIRQLHGRYRLAAISDGQAAYAVPELYAVGLAGFFDPIIVSGNYGYRKPDPRLFVNALTNMKMKPSEVLFVGNDMYRDVYGAQRVGMKTSSSSQARGLRKRKG